MNCPDCGSHDFVAMPLIYELSKAGTINSNLFICQQCGNREWQMSSGGVPFAGRKSNDGDPGSHGATPWGLTRKSRCPG